MGLRNIIRKYRVAGDEFRKMKLRPEYLVEYLECQTKVFKFYSTKVINLVYLYCHNKITTH